MAWNRLRWVSFLTSTVEVTGAVRLEIWLGRQTLSWLDCCCGLYWGAGLTSKQRPNALACLAGNAPGHDCVWETGGLKLPCLWVRTAVRPAVATTGKVAWNFEYDERGQDQLYRRLEGPLVGVGEGGFQHYGGTDGLADTQSGVGLAGADGLKLREWCVSLTSQGGCSCG